MARSYSLCLCAGVSKSPRYWLADVTLGQNLLKDFACQLDDSTSQAILRLLNLRTGMFD